MPTTEDATRATPSDIPTPKTDGISEPRTAESTLKPLPAGWPPGQAASQSSGVPSSGEKSGPHKKPESPGTPSTVVSPSGDKSPSIAGRRWRAARHATTAAWTATRLAFLSSEGLSGSPDQRALLKLIQSSAEDGSNPWLIEGLRLPPSQMATNPDLWLATSDAQPTFKWRRDEPTGASSDVSLPGDVQPVKPERTTSSSLWRAVPTCSLFLLFLLASIVFCHPQLAPAAFKMIAPEEAAHEAQSRLGSRGLHGVFPFLAGA